MTIKDIHAKISTKRLQRLVSLLPHYKSHRKDLQSCVSNKIPKLLDEGYEQEQAQAIAYSMCGEKSEGTPGTDVQMIKLAKEKFPNEDEAKKWLEMNGYNADKPQHDDTHWGYEQFDKSELEGEPKEMTMDDGTIAVVGSRKVEAKPDETEPKPEGEVKEDMPLESDGDGMDSELEEPGETEQPKKAGEIFTETLLANLSTALDMLESAGDTQERQDILEAAPTITEMMQEIVAAVEEIHGNADKMKKADEPADKDKPEEKPDTEKTVRLASMWNKAKGNDVMREAIAELLPLLADLYHTDKGKAMSHTHKLEIRKQYQTLKRMVTIGEFPKREQEPTLDELIGMMRQEIAPLRQELNQLTGAAP